jgi:hypothetical protein
MGKTTLIRRCLNCNKEFNYNPNTIRESNRKYCSSLCSKHCNGKNNLGKRRTEEYRSALSEKLKGENNPFFGKHHSDQVKEKLSKERIGKRTGPNNHNWKGGLRWGNKDGYLRMTDGTFLHRRIMEKKIGRPLRNDEHVHHKDNNKLNNHPDNLEVLSNSEHRKLHAKDQKRNIHGKFAA